jgi:molecular chaperone GrpE (heat shock protein)
MNSSSKEAAMASVVQNFLPILEDLEYLGETYGDDDFGKSYAALAGTLKSGMKELGVEEYSVGIGEKVDSSRAVVVGEEYSKVFGKGIVIRPISTGMELQGNIMKLAECVVSLGEEEDDEEDESYATEEEESEGEQEEMEPDE